MKDVEELTKEEFATAYPVGTRIMWQNRKGEAGNWLPGLVVEAERETKFDPAVWFLLDRDTDGIPRFISLDYQHLIKKEATEGRDVCL